MKKQLNTTIGPGFHQAVSGDKREGVPVSGKGIVHEDNTRLSSKGPCGVPKVGDEISSSLLTRRYGPQARQVLGDSLEEIIS